MSCETNVMVTLFIYKEVQDSKVTSLFYVGSRRNCLLRLVLWLTMVRLGGLNGSGLSARLFYTYLIILSKQTMPKVKTHSACNWMYFSHQPKCL